jgi:hypothetical protein
MCGHNGRRFPKFGYLFSTNLNFYAIASTMPLGSVAYEPEANANGERYLWLEPNVVNRLRALRGPGESYSDVILRLAKA